jgi:hypothetical protein
MVVTIIEVLASISKTIPVSVFDGALTKMSKRIAKEAMKKAKKIWK